MKRLIFAALAALMLLPAAALAKDRNHDGLPDRWEKSHRLSLHVNQARRDQDHDGLRNKAEFKHGTNPRSADSDNDGTPDGSEAGKVKSFDAATGTLVITLLNGTDLTGVVNDSTEIECGASDDHTTPTTATASDHGDDPGGDDQGGDDQGDDNQGDDNQGDDNQGDDDQGDGDDDASDGDHNCSTDHLTADALVHEAQLNATGAGSVWDQIELV